MTSDPSNPIETQGSAEARVCCICGAPLTPPYNIIGQRTYCARHFTAVNKPHPGFWRTVAVQLAVMAFFCGAVAALAGPIDMLDPSWLLPIGVLLALIPTALWLAYFYRQDRLEPEPKTKIGQAFLLALLLTSALGLPLINDWFRVASWASLNGLTSLAASILITGFILQAITYTAVRVAVYNTPEFDERMDGVVYGTVAGLGAATALNLQYVLANEGVALAQGVIQITTTALALASFGGLAGWFMAEAKFAHKPVWWVPMGVTIAAVLNGLFRWLVSEVSVEGLGVAPWRSLILGLVVALLTFLALSLLMRRSYKATLTEK